MSDRAAAYPIGAGVTVEQLETNPYPVLAELCEHEPVSWLPALDSWWVTSRQLAIEAMRDAERFTVDDPRFTTGAILGPSMLSLDGDEHQRHRSPFAPGFRPGVLREHFDDFLATEVRNLLDKCDPGATELRTQLAGPLAVNTITRFLGLKGVSPDGMLDWYRHIATAITDLTLEGNIDPTDQQAVDEIKRQVHGAVEHGEMSTIMRSIAESGSLRIDELGSAALVIMFGAIETAEGMTANALWHLLSNGLWSQLAANPDVIANAIEESLRLEPAASLIDRYAATDALLGTATIPAGEKVSINLLAANRDPNHFADPATFAIERPNAKQHVTFVQGPHGCIGLHLARMETHAAITGLIERAPGLTFDADRSTDPEGFIFRKPDQLWASW